MAYQAMHSPRRALLVAWALALLAGPAQAATVNVSAANTSGVEDGSVARPWSTIAAGVMAAAPGDVVRVAPGIYHGTVELKSDVLLVSAAGAAVTIVDAGGGDALRMPPGGGTVYVDGFTLRNGRCALYVENRASFWSPTWTTIRNCVAHGFSEAFMIMPRQVVLIERTVIYDVQIGVYHIWETPPVLRHLTIDRATRAALYLYQSAMHVFDSSITSSAAGVGGAGHYWTGTVYGWNVNLFGNAADVDTEAAELPDVFVEGRLAVDPLYVDAEGHDYHLRAGSPLVDAGRDDGDAFAGAAPDIGACEAGESAEEFSGQLAESIGATPAAVFKNAAEQRRSAFQQKVLGFVARLAILDTLPTAQERLAGFRDALDKLDKDIFAKADGFHGGNPANDWITTHAEQDVLFPYYQDLRASIVAEILEYGGAP